MATESAPLISPSPSGYSSIGTNVLDDNTTSAATSNFDDLIPSVEDIANYLSAAKLLDNRGAVARDHLANERTFLAYIRTSLATISTGVVVTQLFRINESRPIHFAGGEALGTYLIFMGIILVVYAAIRFFHCQESLTRGLFPVTTNVPVVTSCMLSILCIALLFMNTNHPV